ncbi:sulfotransferase family protein [Roseobacteraceae bacterium S113]
MVSGKKFKFPGDPALKAAQALWNSPDLHPVDKSQLGYALAKAHEDLGHYDQVFSYLDPANQIRNDQHPYPASSRKAYLEDVLQAADEASVRRIGTSTQAPIFVIGTPRSGTTLVERIIAAHPQVKAGGEVGQGYFLHAVTMRESGKTRPLASAEAQDLDRFGAYYMRSAQETAQTNDLRITDKSIQNYIIMGWLAAAFPNARFIVVRRDPRDVALSIYKNYFAPNTHTYAQKLENIAFMMKLFDQAISHWSSRIDVSEVNYDVLTNDPEQESKKLIAAAGLEWDDACSRFYENKQTVSTLSLAQVRQPIYKSSSGAWKRYERELQPFIDAYYG